VISPTVGLSASHICDDIALSTTLALITTSPSRSTRNRNLNVSDLTLPPAAAGAERIFVVQKGSVLTYRRPDRTLISCRRRLAICVGA
jgi:hypothetical protein